MRVPFGPIHIGNVKTEAFEHWFEKVFGTKPTRSTIPLFNKSDFSKDKIVTISGESDKFTWHMIMPRQINQPPSHQ